MATLDKEIRIIAVKGQKGDAGSSIASIEKTATSGKTDTYTITLTDGSTTTFQVTNGEVTLEQFRVFESELEDFCDDFEQQIDVIDNDINNQTTGLKTKVLNIQNYLNNANLNLNEILSLINNTTSDKSNWIFTPKYSYHNFEVGTDTDDVLEAVIKQLCIDYPNKQHITFFGNIEPNSTGIYFLHIYNTSDLTNGLPRYSMGLYVGNERFCNFGTWEYEYKYSDDRISNNSISATASTTTTNCTFNILTTTKNVIARTGAIVLVEYDITAYLDYDSGFSSSGTAIGTINLTIPTGFRPSIAIPLNISADITGSMTATSTVASKLYTDGTMSITCRGNYNGYVDNAEYKIRLYGTYTTL